MRDVLSARLANKRTTIVGVGNPLRGDDGIGPALADRLQGQIDAAVFDAGEAPENYLGAIAATEPQAVIIVDAIDLGARPGDTALLEVDRLIGGNGLTHTTGLAFFARLLQTATGADVMILAVQPESTRLGAPLSSAVVATLWCLADMFWQVVPEIGREVHAAR